LSDSQSAALNSNSNEKKKNDVPLNVKWNEEEKSNSSKLIPLKGINDAPKDDLVGNSSLPPLRGNKFDMGLDDLLGEKEKIDN